MGIGECVEVGFSPWTHLQSFFLFIISVLLICTLVFLFIICVLLKWVLLSFLWYEIACKKLVEYRPFES